MDVKKAKEEYLKRYMSDQKPKKAKKQKKAKKNARNLGLKIHDDDAFLAVAPGVSESSSEDEAENEVKELMQKKAEETSKFKRAAFQAIEIGHNSNHGIVESLSNESGAKKKKSLRSICRTSDSADRPSLLKMIKDEPIDPADLARESKADKNRISTSASPDLSPSRSRVKRRLENDSADDSDQSVKRMRSISSRQLDESGGLAPIRQNKANLKSDHKKRESHRKLSPTRSGKIDVHSDQSPVRSRGKGDKNVRHLQLKSPKIRLNQDDFDQSPPRGSKRESGRHSSSRRRDSSADRHRSIKDEYSSSSRLKNHPSNEVSHRVVKKSSGLQTLDAHREEMQRLKEHEDKVLGDQEINGEHTSVVRRTKFTGKNRENKEDRARKEREAAKQQELEEKYKLWSKGMRQVEVREEKLNEMARVAQEDFARYADDTAMNETMKQELHKNDPMYKYVKKKRDEVELRSGTAYPKYTGSWPPNRFSIPPGYRWDGVNRSNGFEDKMAQVANRKAAQRTEYYQNIVKYERLISRNFEGGRDVAKKGFGKSTQNDLLPKDDACSCEDHEALLVDQIKKKSNDRMGKFEELLNHGIADCDAGLDETAGSVRAQGDSTSTTTQSYDRPTVSPDTLIECATSSPSVEIHRKRSKVLIDYSTDFSLISKTHSDTTTAQPLDNVLVRYWWDLTPQNVHIIVTNFLNDPSNKHCHNCWSIWEQITGVSRIKMFYVITLFCLFHLLSGELARLFYYGSGVAYPMYKAFSAFKNSNSKASARWLRYWVVYGWLAIIDVFLYRYMKHCSIYWLLKSLLILYLLLPLVKGADLIYREYIKNFNKQIEMFVQLVNCYANDK